MSSFSKQNYQHGQILLVVILLITAALTIGLSIGARSIINVRLSNEEDHSQRAFSAAEAGIEQALLTNSAIANQTFSNNASYTTNITPMQGTNLLLNNGKLVLRDEGVDIWLSDYSPDTNALYQNQWSGTFTLYWGNASDICNSAINVNTMPAIQLIVLSGNKNSPAVNYYVYDGCGARRVHNRFNSPAAGGIVSGTSYTSSATISVTNGLIARVIPLYANTFMGIIGAPALPSQGSVITSTGSVNDVKRKISVTRQYPLLPIEFFSYTVIAPR